MSDIILVKKKLSTLLNDDSLVEKYLEQFGSDINIKNIKQIKSQRTGGGTAGENAQQLIDPTYSIKVRCPVCKQDEIAFHELKAKSQSVTHDHFMNPVYSGALGFSSIDFSLLAVAVCHRCFFASSQKKEFITYSLTTRTEINSILNSQVILKLKDKIQNRKEIMGSVAHPLDYFSPPRNAQAAVMAYKLALIKAGVEIEFEIPFSLYKAGTYALRIAYIRNNEGQPHEKALLKALEYYSKAFSTSNVPTQDLEYQMIYVIIALNLRLKREKEAQDYIKVLEKLKSETVGKKTEITGKKPAHIENWLNKAKILWDDRDFPNLWK